MKHILLTLAAFAALGTVISCSDEETPVPNVKDTSYYFEPQPDDTTEEASIRRTFFETYGSHLLFNDTLQHEFLGVNFLGDSIWFTEKLDVNYFIGTSTNTNSYSYTYKLIKTLANKKLAVDFLETYILPHFTADLQPYSWLLVDTIIYYSNGPTSYPYAASGQRATVIRCANLARYSETQKARLAIQPLSTLVAQIVNNYSDNFNSFKKISQAYYGRTFIDENTTLTTQQNTAYLRAAGFLSRGKNGWNMAANGYYPDESSDLSDYGILVVNYTLAQIEQMYGEWPVVIQKATLFRDILHELGYKFDDDLAAEAA